MTALSCITRMVVPILVGVLLALVVSWLVWKSMTSRTP